MIDIKAGFIMEVANKIKANTYLDQHGLSIESRLEGLCLFV